MKAICRLPPVPIYIYRVRHFVPYHQVSLSKNKFITGRIREQKAKIEWQPEQGKNPYTALPRMVMLTYQLPDAIRDVAIKGEFNEFDLNLFFKPMVRVNMQNLLMKMKYKKWLDLIRNFAETMH